MESQNDPTEMNTSMMIAYHNGAWTCPTPFYTEDWTHRDMYSIMYVLTPEVKVLGCGGAAHQAPQHQRCRGSLLLHLKLPKMSDFIH